MRWFQVLRMTVLAAGLTVTPGAFALGLYFGLGVGQSESDPAQMSDPETEELVQELQPLGGTVNTETKGDSLKAFIGLGIIPLVSLEAGKLDMGDVYDQEVRFSDSDPLLGEIEISDNSKVEVDGTYFAVVGRVPLGIVAVNGRAGIYKWDAKLSSEISIASDCCGSTADNSSNSEDGNDNFYGVGLEFGAFGVQYERYKLDDADIDYLGLVIKFGS